MRRRGGYGWLILACMVLPLAAGSGGEVAAMQESRTSEAAALMAAYAARTGLTSGRPRQRYLWTDAFAVCNFLGLARATGDQRFIQLAIDLVGQVHHTLGRHRADDGRKGWISGLSEREGEAHPTQGGLRIGKPRPERRPHEPFDEQLEWDRDGQYFHYLTKWMHALDQLTRATGQARFNVWARELGQSAQHAFTRQPSASVAAPRLYWKMSVDLTRPLVPAMGQHDPLDGYLTYTGLRATASVLPPALRSPGLDGEIHALAAMLEGSQLATGDPLGIGGLLSDAYRAQQLYRDGGLPDQALVEDLLSAALAGLQEYARSGERDLPPEYRLAFRELGLAIGLHAVELMSAVGEHDATGSGTSPGVRTRLQALREYLPLGAAIVAFWRNPEHRRAATWLEHRDINEVMLATSLAPEGFLVRP